MPYQNSICPWHAHDPVSGTIEEWEFGGVTYDCLHPTECLLIETKHGYGGFLEQTDWSASGRPKLQDWLLKAGKDPFAQMKKQARRQWLATVATGSKANLKWVFSEQITEIYMVEFFLNNNLWAPLITGDFVWFR